MKIKVITTCDWYENFKPLEKSLNRYGWEYECLIRHFLFGYQYMVLRDHCNTYTGDATHFLYTDAYDTFAFAGEDEVKEKLAQNPARMIISAEKACFPNFEDAPRYPETKSPWKFINGGGCLFEIDFFKYLSEKYPMQQGTLDPVWLFNCLLNEPEIKLDYQCEIFQTLAHSNVNEWDTTGERIRNIGTNTYPVFFHGNGHTNMDWVYKHKNG